MSHATLHCGDALTILRTLSPASVQCCVTSPPYWGLRDYGTPGQLGLEPTPQVYVANLVTVFREVRRVLRDDGILWLNLGDSYCGSFGAQSRGEGYAPLSAKQGGTRAPAVWGNGRPPHASIAGLKPKDLVGIPWRVAFALQADGWWLRSDIIWSKPNAMPESVTDRPTKSHEYVFLLAKSAGYYYDSAAIAEPLNSSESDVRKMQQQLPRLGGRLDPSPLNAANPQSWVGRVRAVGGQAKRRSGNHHRIPGSERIAGASHVGRGFPWEDDGAGRNARTVWEIATQPYPEAHFATFPEALARRCLLAGSRPGDCVLDPFGGSGTVAAVAVGNGRESIYIDLNPAYVELARQRIGPLLCVTA